ncbi:hypothetical protein QA635_39055 [Bradyrhizobium brasilense]|uniref:hypothetical protein n=1 Tax=Bradyrhizobium brasilense TaxID=1419277 RepID=UPI0024B1A6E0|nr:hypothetical protein [Bradyrhizobium australafricanum]WFU32413.1 hypothetical protein QA635_39055 [Bradyrhizobium australafricanum]
MAATSCNLTAAQTVRRLVLNSYLVRLLLIWVISATPAESRADDGRSSPVVPDVRVECSLKRKAGELFETEAFVAREHFKEDITPTARVRISWLGATFMRRYAVKVETEGDPSLQTYILRNPSNAVAISEEPGARDETQLANVWCLLRLQANGESGTLQTNSIPNIFFVRDGMGDLGVVDILWGGAGWEIGASPIGNQRTWPLGTRVFSHGAD